jgi:Ring finger domain
MSTTQPSATIMDQVSATTTGSASATSSSAATQPSTSSLGAPTTAVAMSILYSITGIITLLFLVIIATGAIRAHRHPERYGPRGGLPGRPRQSRAKGLARAMLETLPIVKFGDGEAKPENREIELEEGGSEQRQQGDAAVPVQTVEGERQAESTKGAMVQETGIGPDEHTHTHAEGSHTEAQGVDEHLGCSICTEDFEKGEDVRVLPCNHKFHPACIDPWLLNVSGTCPLW